MDSNGDSITLNGNSLNVSASGQVSQSCCDGFFTRMLLKMLSSSEMTVTNESIFDFFRGVSSNFKQGQTDAINGGIDFFASGDYISGDFWGPAIYNFGVDFANGNTLLAPSNEYMFGLANSMASMSVNDWAYAGGYASPGFALGAGSYALSFARFGLSMRPSASFFKLHKRITTPGYADIRGYGFGQYDAGHRATTFLRQEILSKGKFGIKNYKTIFFNHTIDGQHFSIGINPWTRTIFHEGPGIFK